MNKNDFSKDETQMPSRHIKMFMITSHHGIKNHSEDSLPSVSVAIIQKPKINVGEDVGDQLP